MSRERQCSPSLALFSADTDQIKEYVFESARLPEIRGASMILDDLNWGAGPGSSSTPTIADLFRQFGLSTQYYGQAPAGTLLNRYGGSLLAVLPNENEIAPRLEQAIEQLYPQVTGTATITCVWSPANQAHIDQCFHQLLALQSARLRRKKQERSSLPFFETTPYARRCESCGKRPANCLSPAPAARYLCWPCEQKRQRSHEPLGKRLWATRFERFLSGDGAPYRQAYYSFQDQPVAEPVVGALDLPEIAQASTEKGYIAFLYADGNRVGQQVERSPTPQEYIARSHALFETIQAAVYRALARHLHVIPVERRARRGQKERCYIHPFEIITIGGDDLLLIVPGDVGLAIARDICSEFEQNVGQEAAWSEAPTMSAGVVIADHHNPVNFLRDIADDLLKKAKGQAREMVQRKQTGGTLDFIVLKSQSMLSTDVRHLRSVPPLQRVYPEATERLILTRRPYALPELTRLMELVREFRRGHFPRSRLQGIQGELLASDRQASTLFYLYQFARSKEMNRELLARLFPLPALPSSTDAIPPWQALGEKEGYQEYATLLTDLLEIYDFAEEGKHASAH